MINFIASHNNLITPTEHQPFLQEHVIAKLFEMNFNNMAVMFDSRIIRPPIFNLLKKAKYFDKTYTMNAF